MGKSGKKQRLAILERAYDKAVRGEKQAEMESRVLRSALLYSAAKAKHESKSRRDRIWAHFGWDTPEGQAKWEAIRKEIMYGKSV